MISASSYIKAEFAEWLALRWSLEPMVVTDVFTDPVNIESEYCCWLQHHELREDIIVQKELDALKEALKLTDEGEPKNRPMMYKVWRLIPAWLASSGSECIGAQALRSRIMADNQKVKHARRKQVD